MSYTILIRRDDEVVLPLCGIDDGLQLQLLVHNDSVHVQIEDVVEVVLLEVVL